MNVQLHNMFVIQTEIALTLKDHLIVIVTVDFKETVLFVKVCLNDLMFSSILKINHYSENDANCPPLI